MKKLYIAEKPSVATEFAKALRCNGTKRDGYIESEDIIVTWCVGHLVTMSYPEVYDASLKKWTKETLPFLPETFKYEIIPSVKKQFDTVSGLLNRSDVDTIYVCTDSGREGEYIYRLVDMMAKVPNTKDKRRVWIDSQTEDEILRGIREAKPISEYDNISSAAYLRAKEDYLMGINFSRILSVTYGYTINDFIKSKKWLPVSVGRVMTCVLGMIVKREREIRNFVKTPFYRVIGSFSEVSENSENDSTEVAPIFNAEWKAVEGSKYFETPYLYKENGFKDREVCEQFVKDIAPIQNAVVDKLETKKEKKNPPLLFNLAELQNICSKVFKISPDETLAIAQELYEKKLITYPRTDARVLSSAISKQIYGNIKGLTSYPLVQNYAKEILDNGLYKGIEKTKYVNDSQITDHYAIIPTGQGLSALNSLPERMQKVYEVIVRRFLAIFYPAAEYKKVTLTILLSDHPERFFTSSKILTVPGFLPVTEFSFKKKNTEKDDAENTDKDDEEVTQSMSDEEFAELLKRLKKGSELLLTALNIKEGETSPPKRYNSGQMILAMENAGQLIEDEDLRAQIKGSGIGTSATRAEILKKLVNIGYINLNKKTQIYTPALTGEAVYEVVNASIKSLLNPELTASWELGLSQVANGEITEKQYMDKLEAFIRRNVDFVKDNKYIAYITQEMNKLRQYY
ncbi:MAG: type IA DNA topoisomerase [Lachnospiraceae bacterium]|nr:type IA DNA topoisomerase [Lachnospiraceae bacterium]